MPVVYRNERRRRGGLLAAALLLAAGCGSGEGKRVWSVETGTPGGNLQAVQIHPAPGSAFISRSTTFQMRWPDGASPPSSFEVRLQRYREARGDEPRQIETQRSVLRRVGEGFVWQLRRSDDFALETSGVYYLELSGGGQEVLAAYIVSDFRAQETPAPPRDGPVEDALVHRVTVAANGGSGGPR